MIITLQVIGLSHSEIRGSRDICSYPRLIAAYHVLHRLREPRHPPCALILFCRYHPHITKDMRTIVVLTSAACDAVTSNDGHDMLMCSVLQFCLCQYVKDLWSRITLHFRVGFRIDCANAASILFSPMWRITDSNR